METLAKFHHNLLGQKFIIRTDQRSLKSLCNQIIQTPEQHVWIHKFWGYDFTIEYNPGKENVVADTLSRSFFMALSEPHASLLSQIEQATNMDLPCWIFPPSVWKGMPLTVTFMLQII